MPRPPSQAQNTASAIGQALRGSWDFDGQVGAQPNAMTLFRNLLNTSPSSNLLAQDWAMDGFPIWEDGAHGGQLRVAGGDSAREPSGLANWVDWRNAGNFTLEIYARVYALASFQALFALSFAGIGAGVEISYNGDTPDGWYALVRHDGGGLGYTAVPSGIQHVLGNDVHLHLTSSRDPQTNAITISIYVDGVFGGSAVLGGNLPAIAPDGLLLPWPGHGHDMALVFARAYGRGLTAPEIATVFADPFLPVTPSGIIVQAVEGTEPLAVLCESGDAGLYARATAYSSEGVAVGTLPLTDRGGGLYHGLWTPPGDDVFSVVYELFDDAAYTQPSARNLPAMERVDNRPSNAAEADVAFADQGDGNVRASVWLRRRANTKKANLLEARVTIYEPATGAVVASQLSASPVNGTFDMTLTGVTLNAATPYYAEVEVTDDQGYVVRTRGLPTV